MKSKELFGEKGTFVIKRLKEEKKVRFKSTINLPSHDDISDGEKFEEIITLNEDFSKRLPARPLSPMKSQIESKDSDDSNEEEEDNKKKRKKKAAITRADVDRFRLEVNVTTNRDS
ncbi:unnamed protein product [Rhizophagus irregularis]|nr:unnamed protein product [Rhizophagus irregularis]